MDASPLRAPPAEGLPDVVVIDAAGAPPASYSVSEVLAIADQAVRLALPEAVWIRGEVANYRPAASGRHRYFDLAERQNAANGRRWDASASAIIWQQRWPALLAKLEAAGVAIENGQEMLFLAQVRVFDGGGKVSLHVTDVLPEFTLGRIEQERRAILARLEGEGLLAVNRRHPLPVLPLRIGLVTSSDARGMTDFLHVLEASGYAFTVFHVNAAVQGAEMEGDVCRALALLARRRHAWRLDAVCIVRGGGNASDLGWWNSYAVCAAVARMPLPVICGIGHEKDCVAVEDVAHTRASTPTAAAQLLVGRVREQESTLARQRGALLHACSRSLLGARDAFDCVRQLFVERTAAAVSSLQATHGYAAQRLRTHAAHRLDLERRALATRRDALADRGGAALARLRSSHELAAAQLAGGAAGTLEAAKERLGTAAERLRSQGTHALTAGRRALQGLRSRLGDAAPTALERIARAVEQARWLVAAHDPLAVLRRGYSVTVGASGRPITDAAAVPPGSRITTLFANGRLSSTVDATPSSGRHA